MKELVIDEGTVEIKYNEYNGCDYDFVKLPKSLRSISVCAFSNSNIKKLFIPNGVSNIDAYSFARSKIDNLFIPKSVKNLGQYAFFENELETVVFQDGIDIIPDSCFRGNKITTLILPNTLTTIGDNAFLGNDLKVITIPLSVKSIGSNAFRGVDVYYGDIFISKEEIDKRGTQNLPLILREKMEDRKVHKVLFGVDKKLEKSDYIESTFNENIREDDELFEEASKLVYQLSSIRNKVNALEEKGNGIINDLKILCNKYEGRYEDKNKGRHL